VTEVNGLRLAYRGFIAGIIGAYVWVAIAMVTALPGGDPLRPIVLVGSLGPGATASEAHAFVLGLAVAQVVGGGVGIGFAYFFARFFTVRPTLGTAGICVAMLAWGLVSNRLAVAVGTDPWALGRSVELVMATLAYGWVLGWSVPVRGDVERSPESASPST
jgi:hypothetical protein